MILKDLAKQLANRINQEHYVLHYLNKVANYFYKKGKEETEKQFAISGVSNRRELLIATLYGWQDYKEQGISIEDYVDEIESNLQLLTVLCMN